MNILSHFSFIKVGESWQGLRYSTFSILFSIGLLFVILMVLFPMPAWALDLGLAISFCMATFVFTFVVFVSRPIDFSSFPTILLASLMLRLSLNISSTKLIIGEGHQGTDAAGHVIEGVAMFVMGGDPLIGVVIFLVLLIVNFIVITKGAARMAEVGARFALDGMPGKQLAIDADVSSGAISHKEAKERRDLEQAEASFFGSLDGASKFVKGDAIAGLLITLLNLIVGLSVGLIVHGLAFSDAVNTYAILTVGDGLVTQIPAVIISVASALLLSSVDNEEDAGNSIADQLSSQPLVLAVVGGLMFILSLAPGLPVIPFTILAVGLLGGAAFILYKELEQPVAEVDSNAVVEKAPSTLGDMISIDDLHVEFAPNLIGMVLDPITGLEHRIDAMRRHFVLEYGVIIPEVRLTDQVDLPTNHYRIIIQGIEASVNEIFPEKIMVLEGDFPEGFPAGVDVTEPVYGAPARWISDELQDRITLSGLTAISAPEVLATHLLEEVRKNLDRFLTLRSFVALIDEMKNLSDLERSEANRKFLDRLIPDKVSVEQALSISKLLLSEGVSIRNMPLILESISRVNQSIKSPEAICEYVRQQLSRQIVSKLDSNNGMLHLVQVSPDWEKVFERYQVSNLEVPEIALPPDEFNRLAGSIEKSVTEMDREKICSAVVVSARRRRFIALVANARSIRVPVISYEELGIQKTAPKVSVAVC